MFAGPSCSSSGTSRRKRLDRDFYDVTSEELSKNLLGKILVRRLNDGSIIRGRIVETECYVGGGDMACRLYNRKQLLRNEMMFMKPGTTYVHKSYDSCSTTLYQFNIVSQGGGASVLIRALEPLENVDSMITRWKKIMKNSNSIWKPKNLCRGPPLLCVSFGIDKESCSKQDLVSWDGMWIEEDDESLVDEIVCTPRLGFMFIRNKPVKFLRFYIKGNLYVSRRHVKIPSYVINKDS